MHTNLRNRGYTIQSLEFHLWHAAFAILNNLHTLCKRDTTATGSARRNEINNSPPPTKKKKKHNKISESEATSFLLKNKVHKITGICLPSMADIRVNF